MNNSWTIYYNPKCGTCRKALEMLRQKKIEPKVVEYLKQPPALNELKNIARKLGSDWTQMVRTKEPIFEELKLQLDETSKEKLLKAIVDHPILLQRPIVVSDKTAIVARPPEKALQLLA